jgi:hypothetical protein
MIVKLNKFALQFYPWGRYCVRLTVSHLIGIDINHATKVIKKIFRIQDSKD